MYNTVDNLHIYFINPYTAQQLINSNDKYVVCFKDLQLKPLSIESINGLKFLYTLQNSWQNPKLYNRENFKQLISNVLECKNLSKNITDLQLHCLNNIYINLYELYNLVRAENSYNMQILKSNGALYFKVVIVVNSCLVVGFTIFKIKNKLSS